MPDKTATKVEGHDEKAALEALQLAELGPVSYSDKYRSAMRLTDPDEVAALIEQALLYKRTFVVERVS